MPDKGVASPGVIAAHEGQRVEAVESLMRERRRRRLPVVDAMDILVDIGSMNDLACRAHLTRHGRGDLSAESAVTTLAAIGEPRTAEHDLAAAAEREMLS